MSGGSGESHNSRQNLLCSDLLGAKSHAPAWGREREAEKTHGVFLSEAGNSYPKTVVQAEAVRSGAAGSPLLLPFSVTTVPGAPLCNVSMTQAGTHGSQPGCLAIPCIPLFSSVFVQL